MSRAVRVFALFRDSLQRRTALAQPVGAPERYLLFGLDQLRERGLQVEHNLERERAPLSARLAGSAAKAAVHRVGGYGGDYAAVLGSRRRLNGADVVFSTVDTVGIPLLGLAARGLVRPPIVYVSIGLLPRLDGLRDKRIVRAYARVLRDAAAVVAYGAAEADELREWLGGGNVVFVPFGVDTTHFRPADVEPEVDVLSIGADPQRDFGVLVRTANRNPDVSFRLIASADHARDLGPVGPNLAIDADLPFEAMRKRLAAARVVALPVRENAYSGATTVLLQAMATGKPVVVSRTAAIAEGYGLEDGRNCRLVPPRDAEAFERGILELLRDEEAAAALGAEARATVERELTWERYVDTLYGLLTEAALRHSRVS